MKKPTFQLAFAALTLMLSQSAQAAYLNALDWFNAAAAANTALVQLPAQSIVIRDNYGSYTPATIAQPVLVDVNGPPASQPTVLRNRTFLQPASTDAGQLGGNFGCASFAFDCLGAHTITYALPFPIIGLAGNLDLGTVTGIESIPFLELAYGGPGSATPNPFRYAGFWGDTFAATDTLTIVWTPGLRSTDAGAGFLLKNAQVLAAPGVVRVPEPASMALFGIGLLGLAMTRRGTA